MSSPPNEIILEARNVSKSFLIHKKQVESFKETLAGFFRSHSIQSELFYALRNISFDLRRGEVLGIIGKNGAGKSTLLKILSGIMQPDEGEINFYGKSASILDVGAGFHPELTGRENVFLTGSLYGVLKAETQEKFNDILTFSGIENFIDEPVKNYSAGMYLRLAFSIVAHVDAEILLLDEVMGVGDAEFQLKCQNKIKELINQNKTVIIVSHNLVELSKYAQRIIRLEEGKILDDSESSSIVEKYLEEAYIRSRRETKDGILSTIQPPYFLEDNILDNDFIKVNEIRIVAEGKNHDDEFMRVDKIFVKISLENKTELSIQCGIFTGDLSGGTSLTAISSDSEKKNLAANYIGKMEYFCYFPAYFFNSGLINFRFFFVLTSPDNDLAKAKRFTVSRNIVIKVLRVQTEENIFDSIPGLYRPSFHWTQKLLQQHEKNI